MSMRWTGPARTAVERARLRLADDDLIERAIAAAERLAAQVGSSVVDTDLWRQGLAAVTASRVRRTPRLWRDSPPAPDAPDADQTDPERDDGAR